MVIDKIRKVNVAEKGVNSKASDRMVGKWIKCDNCKEILYKEDVRNNFSVCPNCGKHFRLSSRRRIEQIIDKDTFIEIDENLHTTDPIKFDGYTQKIDALEEKTKIKEAIKISMGEVVGEKIVHLVDVAIQKRLPVIIFCVSGGARMQEGMISLMQMAKTSSALAKLDKEGLLYISVFTDPTTGGVTASFASLGDIILAEPGALIGFAGPRVIEQTIKEKLPDGFQRAEFLLKHGFVDRIVERKNMKEELYKILKFHI